MNEALRQTMNPDLTVMEVCNLLRCSPPTVYRLMARGKLRSYTIGRSRRITSESLDKLRRGE
ncbi:helix-turn-helix domain-containing protein [Pseudomonadota bacterium]|jgi:excisionase family DNA binding protein